MSQNQEDQQNSTEQTEQETNYTTEDKSNKHIEDIKNFFRQTNWISYIKKAFTIANYIEVLCGLLIFIFSLLSLLSSPNISTIAVRMMLAGIGLLVIGLVNIYSTSLCSCFPCCRTINPKFLRTSFLSSFAATFELLLFGGSYLFFEKGWINKAIVTGNKAYFNGLSLDKGGNINDLINEHFIYFRIDAILCIVGFVVTVISCIFCICLLNPEQYLKQMPFIEDQIILICGTEFIFLGAFFKVLDTYSNSIDAIMTATITIGSIIDYSFLMLKILKCCCKKCRPALIIVRIISLIIIAAISVVLAIFILAKMKQFEQKTKIQIKEHCLADQDEYEIQYELNLQQIEIEYKYQRNEQIQIQNDQYNQHKTIFEMIQILKSPENNNTFSDITYFNEKFNINNIQKNENAGADKCSSLITNIETVYYCSQDIDNITGNEEYCNDQLQTTIDKMADFAKTVNKIMVFAFFSITIYVIIALIFTRLSNYLLKILSRITDTVKEKLPIEVKQKMGIVDQQKSQNEVISEEINLNEEAK